MGKKNGAFNIFFSANGCSGYLSVNPVDFKLRVLDTQKLPLILMWKGQSSRVFKGFKSGIFSFV